MAGRRARRERIKRKPYAPKQDGDYARQRAVRQMQLIVNKMRAGWATGQLRWNEVKWLLIAMADLVREELGVQVRMAMIDQEQVGQRYYLAQIQVGDPPSVMTIAEQFLASFEADKPSEGDGDIALSYYNCEPEV